MREPCRVLCAIGVMVTFLPSKQILTVQICYGAHGLSTDPSARIVVAYIERAYAHSGAGDPVEISLG